MARSEAATVIQPLADINAAAFDEDRAAVGELLERDAQLNTLAIKELGDNLPYNRDRLITETRFYMAQSAEAMLEAGKRLRVLKEAEGHGGFQLCLEELGVEERLAQRMMQAGEKFGGGGGSARKLVEVAKNKTKLFELMVLDDELLADLGDDQLRGLTLDDVAKMPTSQLRKALREARQNIEAKEKLLTNKDARINELDEQLTRKGWRAPTWDEQIAPLKKEITDNGTAADKIITNMKVFHDALSGFCDNPEGGDHEKRALVAHYEAELSRMAALVAELQHLFTTQLSAWTYDLKTYVLQQPE